MTVCMGALQVTGTTSFFASEQTSAEDCIVIVSDGSVSEVVSNQTNVVGQITLSRFVNPSGLIAMGRNLFRESDASGNALDNNPGDDGAGTLVQSTLEMSNVQVVEEMVNMIVAQRAYESNAKAVTTSDAMLETANGLKR